MRPAENDLVMMNRKLVLIPLVLLAVVIPLLSLFSGTHQFLGFDDKVNIIDNTAFHGLTRDNLMWMITGTKLGVYEPVSWFVKGVIHEFFGLSPRAFHITSVVFHLLNVALLALCLYIVLNRLFPQHADKQILQVSAVTSLIYGIHPLRAEVVAWASGQSYAVGTLFLLISILTYCRYRHSVDNQKPAYQWLVISAVCYLLAIFGKSAMVLLPVWLVLLDWFVYRVRSIKRIVLEKLPYVAIMIITVVAVALVNEDAMGDRHLILSWPDKLGRAVIALYLYPLQTIWPTMLTPFYALPRWGISITDKVAVTGLIGLLVIAYIVLVNFRKNQWPLVVLIAYGAFLLPVLGFVQHGNPILAADRYTYVSTIPLYLTGAGLWLAAAWQPVIKNHFRVGTGVVILVLGWISIQQVGYWENNRTLWERALEVQPYNGFAGNNLGFDYWTAEEYDTAREYLEAAHLSEPWNEFPLINLGVTYYELDRCDLAIELYLKAAKNYHSESAGLFNNLANCYIKNNEIEESVPHYRRALEIDPNHPKARGSLKRVLDHLERNKPSS